MTHKIIKKNISILKTFKKPKKLLFFKFKIYNAILKKYINYPINWKKNTFLNNFKKLLFFKIKLQTLKIMHNLKLFKNSLNEK